MTMSILEDNPGSKEVESHTSIVIDPAEEKNVLKKLDRVILPLMALVYFFQCIYSSHTVDHLLS
jgi:ACS family allantoate permease-like MFS transporter